MQLGTKNQIFYLQKNNLQNIKLGLFFTLCPESCYVIEY